MKVTFSPAVIEVIEPEGYTLKVTRKELAVIHAVMGSIAQRGNKGGQINPTSVDTCLNRHGQQMEAEEFEKICSSIYKDTNPR